MQKGIENNTVVEDIFILDTEDTYQTNIISQCFNLVNILVCATDLKGKITYINETGKQLLQYDEEDISDCNLIEKLVFENDRQTIKQIFNNLHSGKSQTACTSKFSVISKTGRRIFLNSKILIVRNKKADKNGFLISAENITEYINVHRELQNSVQRHRLLASSIPGINMYLFDRNMRFIIAEGSEMKNHGFTQGDFEGKTLEEVMAPKSLSLLHPLYKAALSGREISTEIRFNDQDFIIWLIPLKNDDDEVYGGMAITQNITQEKLDEKKLRIAKEQAEEANRTKSQFLANVSHEIRTPLNAIVGFSEQLSKTELKAKQKEFVDIIEKSSEHLLTLVNEILVLSKIEAGEMHFYEVPFRVSSVLKEVHMALKIKANEKGLKFTCKKEPDLDKILIGDHFRLKQMLINLINNAIKFTKKGFVRVEGSMEEETDKQAIIKLTVSDSGVGIPVEKQQSIFDQFRQADSTITKKYGGTGLGLSITKRITELLNGTIELDSEAGRGTTFTLKIPYEKGGENDRVEEESGFTQSNILENTEVLIVDDDSINCLLGKTILEEAGCIVDVAKNGREAIDKLAGNNYSFVLLDIHMPDVSGIDVANYIRKELQDQKTKIIAVTASFLKTGAGKYKQVGIDDYIIKPYKEAVLINKMHNLLGYVDDSVKALSVNKIPDQDTGNTLCDYTELQSISNNDVSFYRKMLNTFIHNTKENINNLNKHLGNKNWTEVGETAHKMLPSFRHLKVKSAVQYLIDIESKTIDSADYEAVPGLVNIVTLISNDLISILEKELDQANRIK